MVVETPHVQRSISRNRSNPLTSDRRLTATAFSRDRHMGVFSAITSPVFSDLVLDLELKDGETADLHSEAMLFGTLRKMNEIRPFANRCFPSRLRVPGGGATGADENFILDDRIWSLQFSRLPTHHSLSSRTHLSQALFTRTLCHYL